MEKKKSAEQIAKEVISHTEQGRRGAKGKKHAYQHEKTLYVPEEYHRSVLCEPLTSRKIGKAKIIPQKSRKAPLEQIHCSANQNYPLYFIEKSEAFLKRNVQTVKTKERWVATRSIKRLSHEMQKWISSQFQHKIQVSNKDPIELYHLLERREERHYQIDRIIKYLSDP